MSFLIVWVEIDQRISEECKIETEYFRMVENVLWTVIISHFQTKWHSSYYNNHIPIYKLETKSHSKILNNLMIKLPKYLS